MSRLSDLERKVLRCAGTPAADVARALGVGVERVRAARVRLGRNVEDGLEGSTRVAEHEREDRRFFAEMMRSNTGVC
jgi:hypothetical protein